MVRSIQAFHQDSRGWADIAYNFLVCQHGLIYEGRGLTRGSAANGTTAANLSYYAICAITGEGDPTPTALISGLQSACQMVRDHGAGSVVVGHRDLFQTACPGTFLYAQVKAHSFGTFATPVHPSGAASAYPATAPSHTVAGAPKFPLGVGWYFGPSTGPKASVSGYYGHGSDLAAWQTQMAKRGWKITADGRYGPGTAAVALAFQREKGLHPDSLIGAGTWAAAWTSTVTKG